MTINLPQGAILSIFLAHQELMIECRGGRVWITRISDSQDYVLDQGEKYLLSGSGKVFIEALSNACIGVFGKFGFKMKVNERSVSRRVGLCFCRFSSGWPQYNQAVGRLTPTILPAGEEAVCLLLLSPHWLILFSSIRRRRGFQFHYSLLLPR